MAVEAQERVIVEETRRSIIPSQRWWDDEAWLLEHLDELYPKHINQWVIVYNREVIGAHRDLGVASDMAEAKIGDLDKAEPVTFYIPEARRVL